MNALNKLNELIRPDIRFVLPFMVLLLLIGLWYSGGQYLSNFSSAIPVAPVGAGMGHMIPGDHHEQFYRYSLVYENLKRGRWPYYSGYQFATKDFTEGLIFFPFTAVSGALAFLVGPILAYNILGLLSYIFVGLSGFFLAAKLTGSRVAGLVVGVFLATIPFRTAFLYSQMVYGVDLLFVPLTIYLVESAKKNLDARSFFFLGIVLFLTITANFQLFYWAMFVLVPYFLISGASIARSFWQQNGRGVGSTLYALPGLLACSFYGIFVIRLVGDSVLDGGQAWAEVVYFAPQFSDLLSQFNGNERTVYFGVTALLVLPWALLVCLGVVKVESHQNMIRLFFSLFVLSLVLIFGPAIDDVFSVKFYQWLFETIPGVDGTRTTGRIMSVSSVLFAVLLGYFVTYMLAWRKLSNSKVGALLLSSVIIVGIIVDFRYTNPTLTTLLARNEAYAEIEGSRARVVSIPFQENSLHYFNSTFLPLALRYDIRLFAGHSSVYPRGFDAEVERLLSLNAGFIDAYQWLWLRENRFEYLVVHSTVFEPRVSASVVGGLMSSRFLDFERSDAGIHLFSIRSLQDVVGVGYLQSEMDVEQWRQSLSKLYWSAVHYDGKVELLKGWYGQEVNDVGRSFRWMRGDAAVFLVHSGRDVREEVRFEYSCPEDLVLTLDIDGAKYDIDVFIDADGWSNVSIDLEPDGGAGVFVRLASSRVFTVPTDSRVFGCKISEVRVADPL